MKYQLEDLAEIADRCKQAQAWICQTCTKPLRGSLPARPYPFQITRHPKPIL